MSEGAKKKLRRYIQVVLSEEAAFALSGAWIVARERLRLEEDPPRPAQRVRASPNAARIARHMRKAVAPGVVREVDRATQRVIDACYAQE